MFVDVCLLVKSEVSFDFVETNFDVVTDLVVLIVVVMGTVEVLGTNFVVGLLTLQSSSIDVNVACTSTSLEDRKVFKEFKCVLTNAIVVF